mmetsp:Transcript_20983/g.47407  ORF Transcript_20983/g.47407 Transcript_20983/m.47407 type:complete len:215 (+) Transcript_20983:588-1232(+)
MYRSSGPPHNLHDILVPDPSGLVLGILGPRHDEKAEAPILVAHAQKLSHVPAVPRGVVPRTPVARQLLVLGGLEMHVLHGAGRGGQLLPLREDPRAGPAPGHDRNHVRARSPSACDFPLGRGPPLEIIFSRRPVFLPDHIVVPQCELLHLDHTLLLQDYELCRVHVLLVPSSVERSISRGRKKARDDAIVQLWRVVLGISIREDRTAACYTRKY